MLSTRDCWNLFIEGKSVPEGVVGKAILKSWKRCRKMRVDPYQKAVTNILEEEALKELKEKEKDFIASSTPMLESLASFVSGSGFVIGIADKRGIILEIKGDDSVVASVRRGNFVPGADWSEHSAGTNGVGTPLQTGQPVQIVGMEHFSICSQNWTGSGAPVYFPRNSLRGVIVMTGTSEKVHPHTLGMVVGAAKAIENQLRSLKSLKEANSANKYKEAIMEAISEALLAVSGDGIVTHVNQKAVELLEIPRDTILNVPMKEIFGKTNQELQDIIQCKQTKTDYELDINTPSKRIRSTVTTRIIKNNTNHGDVVIAISEIVRAKKLANRLSGATAKLQFSDIIGEDEKFQKSLELAQAAAKSSSTVLLLGESGTGKDILAQAIHNHSERFQGPFVAINCSAIPRELIGSELFGYEGGAFTGAKRTGNPGKFELAEGGTLFLDEMGEMPIDLQAIFLRVLEEKVLTRIGGQKIIPVDVRVIAASNKDLKREVEEGRFRQDLYYRLNILTIKLPPLRERGSDILNLGKNFLQRFQYQYGKTNLKIQDSFWEKICMYSWPGNVRELQNVIERVIALSQDDELTASSLPAELSEALTDGVVINSLHGLEKDNINRVLQKHNGNISLSARELGIARSTLYRKIKKYNL